ncbi:MAG: hypothetical protein WCJ70_05065, partial [bacterium]
MILDQMKMLLVFIFLVVTTQFFSTSAFGCGCDSCCTYKRDPWDGGGSYEACCGGGGGGGD